MQYRKLRNTGEKVSVLGFGAMRLPTINGENTNIDEKVASEMLRYAIDNGVNYVDTAWPYHGSGMGEAGMSEPFIGKFLQTGYREKVLLASKLPTWLVDSRTKMDEILDQQLKRLQTDYIDFYLVHALNKRSWLKIKELGILDFLQEAKAQGKIKHIGFSFHDDFPTFKSIVDDFNWNFCQIQYNYLDVKYQAGREGLKYAYQKGLDVIIMEPLRGGALVNNLANEIKDLYAKSEKKKSPAEWALGWLWNQQEVGLVLSGMSNLDQVKENIEIADKGIIDSFTDEENQVMEEVQNIFISKLKVNCTTCRYCMPCPSGVNIPEIFTIYNNGYLSDNVKQAKFMYKMGFSPQEKASACIACGKCQSHCPQGIDIINKLSIIKKEFESD
jgi:predicted aldo/keto reductase-like oxidoreductase